MSTPRNFRNILDRNRDGKVTDDIGRGSLILIGVVVVAIILIGAWASYAHRSTAEAVVTSKERVCSGSSNGSSDCKYLVYTDRGTYEISDSIIAFRWSSSDLYGTVRPCHRYDIESFGWRFGPSSMYPNITKMTDKGRVDGCES